MTTRLPQPKVTRQAEQAPSPQPAGNLGHTLVNYAGTFASALIALYVSSAPPLGGEDDEAVAQREPIHSQWGWSSELVALGVSLMAVPLAVLMGKLLTAVIHDQSAEAQASRKLRSVALVSGMLHSLLPDLTDGQVRMLLNRFLDTDQFNQLSLIELAENVDVAIQAKRPFDSVEEVLARLPVRDWLRAAAERERRQYAYQPPESSIWSVGIQLLNDLTQFNARVQQAQATLPGRAEKLERQHQVIEKKLQRHRHSLWQRARKNHADPRVVEGMRQFGEPELRDLLARPDFEHRLRGLLESFTAPMPLAPPESASSVLVPHLEAQSYFAAGEQASHPPARHLALDTPPQSSALGIAQLADRWVNVVLGSALTGLPSPALVESRPQLENQPAAVLAQVLREHLRKSPAVPGTDISPLAGRYIQQVLRNLDPDHKLTLDGNTELTVALAWHLDAAPLEVTRARLPAAAVVDSRYMAALKPPAGADIMGVTLASWTVQDEWATGAITQLFQPGMPADFAAAQLPLSAAVDLPFRQHPYINEFFAEQTRSLGEDARRLFVPDLLVDTEVTRRSADGTLDTRHYWHPWGHILSPHWELRHGLEPSESSNLVRVVYHFPTLAGVPPPSSLQHSLARTWQPGFGEEDSPVNRVERYRIATAHGLSPDTLGRGALSSGHVAVLGEQARYYRTQDFFRNPQRANGVVILPYDVADAAVPVLNDPANVLKVPDQVKRDVQFSSEWLNVYQRKHPPLMSLHPDTLITVAYRYQASNHSVQVRRHLQVPFYQLTSPGWAASFTRREAWPQMDDPIYSLATRPELDFSFLPGMLNALSSTDRPEGGNFTKEAVFRRMLKRHHVPPTASRHDLAMISLVREGVEVPIVTEAVTIDQILSGQALGRLRVLRLEYRVGIDDRVSDSYSYPPDYTSGFIDEVDSGVVFKRYEAGSDAWTDGVAFVPDDKNPLSIIPDAHPVADLEQMLLKREWRSRIEWNDVHIGATAMPSVNVYELKVFKKALRLLTEDRDAIGEQLAKLPDNDARHLSLVGQYTRLRHAARFVRDKIKNYHAREATREVDRRIAVLQTDDFTVEQILQKGLNPLQPFQRTEVLPGGTQVTPLTLFDLVREVEPPASQSLVPAAPAQLPELRVAARAAEELLYAASDVEQARLEMGGADRIMVVGAYLEMLLQALAGDDELRLTDTVDYYVTTQTMVHDTKGGYQIRTNEYRQPGGWTYAQLLAHAPAQRVGSATIGWTDHFGKSVTPQVQALVKRINATPVQEQTLDYYARLASDTATQSRFENLLQGEVQQRMSDYGVVKLFKLRTNRRSIPGLYLMRKGREGQATYRLHSMFHDQTFNFSSLVNFEERAADDTQLGTFMDSHLAPLDRSARRKEGINAVEVSDPVSFIRDSYQGFIRYLKLEADAQLKSFAEMTFKNVSDAVMRTLAVLAMPVSVVGGAMAGPVFSNLYNMGVIALAGAQGLVAETDEEKGKWRLGMAGHIGGFQLGKFTASLSPLFKNAPSKWATKQIWVNTLKQFRQGDDARTEPGREVASHQVDFARRRWHHSLYQNVPDGTEQALPEPVGHTALASALQAMIDSGAMSVGAVDAVRASVANAPAPVSRIDGDLGWLISDQANLDHVPAGTPVLFFDANNRVVHAGISMGDGLLRATKNGFFGTGRANDQWTQVKLSGLLRREGESWTVMSTDQRVTLRALTVSDQRRPPAVEAVRSGMDSEREEWLGNLLWVARHGKAPLASVEEAVQTLRDERCGTVQYRVIQVYQQSGSSEGRIAPLVMHDDQVWVVDYAAPGGTIYLDESKWHSEAIAAEAAGDVMITRDVYSLAEAKSALNFGHGVWSYQVGSVLRKSTSWYEDQVRGWRPEVGRALASYARREGLALPADPTGDGVVLRDTVTGKEMLLPPRNPPKVG